MANLLRPLLDLWQRLTLGQRAGLVLVLGLVIAIAAGTVNYTTRPVYTTLYSGLNGKDAAQILDKLRERKIPFEVGADGGAIKVPQEQVAELRLDFAGAGLPRSGEIGYELFDKPMLGMTDFVQQMNYHRALEGELARSISELDAVESARVHLVVPGARLFREDQKPATASIVLQLKPGAVLTAQQVQGITYMTAYSVEGLAVENITMVDSRGTMLTGRAARNDMAGLSSTQLEVQRSVETDLEQKALGLLENTLGAGRAQVKVTAKLNWNRIERTVEDYSADRAATLSEERQESSGGEDLAGGNSERTVTNYQVPHTIEKQQPEVGNIERISASVLIDGNYKTGKGSGRRRTARLRGTHVAGNREIPFAHRLSHRPRQETCGRIDGDFLPLRAGRIPGRVEAGSAAVDEDPRKGGAGHRHYRSFSPAALADSAHDEERPGHAGDRRIRIQ